MSRTAKKYKTKSKPQPKDIKVQGSYASNINKQQNTKDAK